MKNTLKRNLVSGTVRDPAPAHTTFLLVSVCLLAISLISPPRFLSLAVGVYMPMSTETQTCWGSTNSPGDQVSRLASSRDPHV